MKKNFQSVALIRRRAEGQSLWLARVSEAPSPPEPKTLSFITAHRLEGESFRDAIRREVAWILRLDPERELLVSNMAQLNLEWVDRLPGDEAETHIAVAFFMVQLYGKGVATAVQNDPHNRWLSSAEVCCGRVDSGETLDPTLHYLLARGQVINSWD